MDKNMKDIEKEEKDMDKECILEVMEVLMKVSIQKGQKKDSEYICGQMDKNMKDIEKVENVMDKQFIVLVMEILMQVSLQMT